MKHFASQRKVRCQMFAANVSISAEILIERAEAGQYRRLGAGCYGGVYDIGDGIVAKIGDVQWNEADKLNKAHELIGGVFPRAKLIKESEGYRGAGVMLMEKIEGTTLANVAQSDWRLMDKVLYETREILNLYGIQHGDLHAGNVMIDSNGGIRVVDGASLDFNQYGWY